MDHLLERVLLDPSVDPTELPLLLLKTITNDFSDDAKIGSGGFAAVYRGVLQSGAVIAVKKLVNNPDMDDKKFTLEVGCLMKAKHKNIVRLLGYCSDTQGKILNHEGKMIQAEERQRLLCFEFLPKGSLDNYITDVSGGLEWRTRYKIIKGICEGLHYLHQDIYIVHSDIKPANILLDKDMVPKISDFGLARFFEGKESKILATKVIGTWGYMAPELFQNRAITFKTDIYSLGIVIMEILTGQKGNYDIQNVLTNWSTRFANVPGHPWMQHVKACIEMGIKCIDLNPEKRPITQDIIDMLVDMEHAYGFNETDFCTSSAAHEGVLPVIPSPSPLMIDVYPLDILFPFKPKNPIKKCPVTLTNRTGDIIGIWITPTSLDVCSKPGYPYVWETYERRDNDPAVSSLFRRLGPHSSETIYMIMRLQEQLPLDENKGMFDVVMVATKSEEYLKFLDRHWNNYDTWRSKDPLRGVEALGTVVHRATLRVAVTREPAGCEEVTAHQFIQGEGSIICMDVHPTKTWLLVGYLEGNVSIWNYETQERIIRLDYLEENLYGKSRIIRSIIAGEQWFAAGYNDGCVHVYAYTFAAEKDMVKALEAHIDKSVTCLAVQPKRTLLLTASCDDKVIKLWDWSQDWTCAREIDVHKHVCDLKFSPRDTRIFASSSYYAEVIKVWDIYSPDAIATIEGSTLTFNTDGFRDFLVTSASLYCDHDDTNAMIWDLDAEKHVHTLRPGIWHWCLSNLAGHPTLPILAAFTVRPGHRVYQIVLWDFRTYRVMKTVELRMKGYITNMVFDGNKDITSLVVSTDEEISIIKINVPTLLTGCATLA